MIRNLYAPARHAVMRQAAQRVNIHVKPKALRDLSSSVAGPASATATP